MTLYINSNKKEFMCFNQDAAISLLNAKPLKLDQFIYFESNINIYIDKTAI